MPKKQAVLFLILSFVSLPALAQRSRIAGRIDNTRRITLKGHLHPRALPQDDRGPVDPSLVLSEITLMLQPSDSQQADLKQFLVSQQDPGSPNYHQWLTPEQYADRFGASQDDINKIAAWLRSQQLTVTSTARGRNAITASGTAAAVGQAFGTEIHLYAVNGEMHFANASDPTIPAALQGMVSAIHGLTDFRLKPATRSRKVLPGPALQPNYTSASSGNHYLAPNDVATIYNMTPLFNNGVNGSGQKVAVVGQTAIRLADIQQFRTFFNLPSNDPQVTLVPGSRDPGVLSCSQGCDLGEADLDIELSGAVARNATILYVYSTDVMNSVQYAIDQNLAPVISMSYGDCEAAYAPADAAGLQQLAQQANAQGITWFAASGDSGATDCYGDGFTGADSAVSADMPASIPEVTGVGGTEFNEGSGTYWNTTNDSNSASALSYIPETSWNDTAADGSPSSSGGGASTFFPKPSWQTGIGVPSDNARHVPDISINSSADHDGYIIFTSDACSGSRGSTSVCQEVVGGTSAGAPIFSGLAALLNQSLVANRVQAAPGLGNFNPKLYSLAQSTPAAFHDITTGNNIIDVTCSFRSRGCTPGPVGFNAGAGYDQVTGLGTIDAHALVTALAGGAPGPGGSNTSGTVPTLTAYGNAASYNQRFAPGMILTIYGSQLSSVTQAANGVPLPPQIGTFSATVNGIAAPLYYVSSTQVNLQIPYEVPTGANAVLTVNNNGQTASVTFPVTAAAPGIFTDSNGAPVPNGTAASGQTVTLYVTGVGSVAPAVADGAAPATSTPLASLPAPQQNLTVTVGGVPAPTHFVGIPWGLVGVVQINYEIPAGVRPGAQPVVVTVNGVASTAATLNVTQ